MAQLKTILFVVKVKDAAKVDNTLSTTVTSIKRLFPGLTVNQNTNLPNNDFLYILISESSSLTFTIRYYSRDGILSVVGEACPSAAEDFDLFTNRTMDAVRDDIENKLGLGEVEKVPLIRRNNPVPNYFLSSLDQIIEYDFDKVLVHEKSKYQDIKILRSPTLGNVLILDNAQNLAEGDLNYTRGLMNYGVNSYKGDSV